MLGTAVDGRCLQCLLTEPRSPQYGWPSAKDTIPSFGGSGRAIKRRDSFDCTSMKAEERWACPDAASAPNRILESHRPRADGRATRALARQRTQRQPPACRPCCRARRVDGPDTARTSSSVPRPRRLRSSRASAPSRRRQRRRCRVPAPLRCAGVSPGRRTVRAPPAKRASRTASGAAVYFGWRDFGPLPQSRPADYRAGAQAPGGSLRPWRLIRDPPPANCLRPTGRRASQGA